MLSCYSEFPSSGEWGAGHFCLNRSHLLWQLRAGAGSAPRWATVFLEGTSQFAFIACARLFLDAYRDMSEAQWQYSAASGGRRELVVEKRLGSSQLDQCNLLAGVVW